MLENILGAVLGGQNKTEEQEEGGIGKLIPLIFVFIVVVYGLKLLKPKEEDPV